MRKIILASLLTMALLLSFAACGTQTHTHPEENTPTQSQDGTIENSTASPTQNDSGNTVPSTGADAKITAEQAKAAAFQHAGVNESNVYDLKVELNRDDGVLHYDVDFETGGNDYEYDINAETGAIISSEKDRD